MKEQINIYLETIQTNVKECGPEELMKSPEEMYTLAIKLVMPSLKKKD
jgi:hypothetical protein